MGDSLLINALKWIKIKFSAYKLYTVTYNSNYNFFALAMN